MAFFSQENFKTDLYYAHTNRFCVVQENISPRSLKYRPSLRGLCIKTEGFIFPVQQQNRLV